MVAKRAGQFAGGFLNNPGALAAIGIAVSIITTLIIFRNDIRGFFGTTIPEALGSLGDINIQLPSIQLPSFELPTFDFTLPTIEFPSFEDIFGEPPLEPAPLTQPGEGLFNPADQPVVPTPIDVALSEGATPEDIAAMLTPEEIALDPNQDPSLFQPPVIEPIPLPDPISPITGFGGPSFEGGTIFETPIENLSLNQIIEMGLAETASEAANLKAIAEGFTPEQEEFLGQQGTIGGISVMEPTGPAVSDPTVAGLTPEEIFAQLFGSVQNPEFGA